MKLAHALAAAVLAGSITTAANAGDYTYRHVLDGSPLDIPTSGEGLSDAVKAFHRTGENPFVDDAEALKEGKKVYSQYCQACHMPDGSGRIGPSFLDKDWRYESTASMRGRFAIVYAGGAGAMQAFNGRLGQDEILKVLAYIEELRAQAGVE
ncbi:c-type cytochrome [Ferruginivarius sediminum]|uniref:Cytochrome c, class I n=1 Tax=Ferruginivarius sediminum TaxID=2661937 RepID=A0A369TDT1_9PROT|nr:c-type cytochrome [Ferruginivarius sediminum]RDD62684.1 cytochrome c, class I [Ferruginivarius sediminum]